MAYGSELFLGWLGKDAIEEALKGFKGVSIDWAGDKDIDMSDGLCHRFADLHEEAIQSILGLKLLGFDGDYPIIETPDGKRLAMSSWGLEFHYDEREMGDTEDTALLGVSLISRYYPTFLDWKEEHGGSGDPIVLDAKTQELIAKAKDLLVREFPIFATADIIVKMIHY